MRRLTASHLDLAAACPASHHLPWQKDTSEAAQNGTARHAFLERAVSGDREGALELLREDLRGRMSRVDIEAILSSLPGPPLAEVALAYDPATDMARELATDGHRDYSLAKPNEIVGTVDLLAANESVGTVLDYKTGAAWVDGARDSLQIRFAAVALSRHAGVDVVNAAVAKIGEDGETLLLKATFDEIDLAAGAHELAELQARVQSSGPDDTVLGPHCRYCPARASCPAQAKAAQQLIEISARSATLTPETAALAWTLMKAVGGAVDTVKDALRAWVRTGGEIRLPNGKKVGFVEQPRESLVLEAAIQQANELDMNIGSVLAASTLSKAAIREHLGPEKGERLIAAIQKAHGTRTAVVEQMRELKG